MSNNIHPPAITSRHSPIFIFSCIRSGSTLLRSILNSHSKLYSPHECHFDFLKVNTSDEYLSASLMLHKLTADDLKMLLWDATYQLLLQRANKAIFIDKTPSNLLAWKRISSFWPNARYIFLKRDPGNIFKSIINAKDGRSELEAINLIANYVDTFEEAIATLDQAHLIKYESLITQPEQSIRNICLFLGVEFEASLLEYKTEGEPYRYGVGDWSDKIKSGKIVANEAENFNSLNRPKLHRLRTTWNYTQ